MSEETILTKDENEKDIKENSVTDNSATVIPTDADTSNVVLFASEPTAADTDKVSPLPEKSSESFSKASEFTEKASNYKEKVSEYSGKASQFASETIQKAASHIKSDEGEDFPEDEAPSKKRFHFRKDDKEFFRDKWILSRISDEQLMEYLTLEQRRNELQQQAKDIKEKRIFTTFQITAALAAIVAVIYLLKDNPTILVNILYIAGILTAFWFWKNPRDK